MEEHCETCKWYRYSKIDGIKVCMCRESKFCGEEPHKKEGCEKWSAEKK